MRDLSSRLFVLVFFILAISSAAILAQTDEQKQVTPSQTEGPFYPDVLPKDTDNDLLVINDSKSTAQGKAVLLSGRVLAKNGKPIANAVVEIWQCDNGGVYLHSKSHDRPKYDTNFQGFGRCVTGPNGEYSFRTIKPVPYTFRTPHIHYIVKKNGKRLLTTQIYVKGEKLNQKDGIYTRLSPQARDAVTVDFVPAKGKSGELVANADMVLGVTPELIDND